MILVHYIISAFDLSKIKYIFDFYLFDEVILLVILKKNNSFIDSKLFLHQLRTNDVNLGLMMIIITDYQLYFVYIFKIIIYNIIIIKHDNIIVFFTFY